MGKVWEEIGENQRKLTIRPDEGGPASVFYGTTDEILEKLADSQAHANGVLNRRYSETDQNSVLARTSQGLVNGNGHSASLSDLKPLTANDRMQAVADLSNPATVDKAVTRVMESVIGSVDQFQRDREAERAERLQQTAIAAVEQFCELTPTYFPSDFNNNTLVGYMQRMGYDPAQVSSYQRAYADLAGAKLLQSKPDLALDENEPPPELHRRNAENLSVPRAPNRYSTGIRSSDISGSPPVPTKRLKFSREQITNMSAETYKRNISDPEFVRCVEYYYAQGKQRKAVPA